MKYQLPIVFCVVLSLPACGQKTVVPGKLQLLESETVFSDAPFRSCHASTLVELTGNKIMAAWFGGLREGNPDVSIWMSIRENGKWSVPKEIANGVQPNNERFACWNPVLFYTRHGSLNLYYRVGTSPATWWTEIKTSVDNGNSWSEARKLPPGFLGPIKNKPVQLKNGDILCPSSYENMSDNKWTIHVERSDSTGTIWKKINIACDSFNIIQPTILTYGDDSLQLLCRTRNNVIGQSWSSDGGNTWTPVTTTTLPNPNSGIDALTMKNGLQLLVYNPTQRGRNGRSVLKIAISADGRQWKDIHVLEEHEQGEYSYPAVIQARDGSIHVSYTQERKTIKYVRLKQ